MRSIPFHILLVDEDFTQYAFWSQLVERLGTDQYQLNWCSDFADAKRCLLSSAYDLVLFDYVTDSQLSRRIFNAARAEGSTTPVVAMCQQDDIECRDKALAAGAADYLYKGQVTHELLERVIRYVSGHQVSDQRAREYANHDPLTGVPNRLLFLDRFSQALRRARRNNDQCALFYLDLDQFKKVNDSFGHAAGDRLLEKIVGRLQPIMRSTDTLARLGGDEFAVLLEEFDSTADLVHMAGSITDALSQPFDLEEHQLMLGASLGIAVYPDAGEEVDTLLRHADVAKNESKQVMGPSYRFFSEQMNLEAQSQLYREAELRRALRRNEFSLYYQPRVDLASGQIVGMEALVRWQHPVRGTVKPGDFIPLAEEVGLIQPLGYWVVHQACEDIKKMEALGLPELEVAINLSFKQFDDPGFAATVESILKGHEVKPGRVEFELTETAIMDSAEATHRCMNNLAGLGASFSLDDFGTGYSSFAHIQRLPISIIKIDRRFLQYAHEKEEDASLVKGIIGLAHGLDMRVVAEGAETAEHIRLLKSLNCDQVQGYYFSPPIELGDLCQLVQEDIRLVV